ncbi:MAG TPA: hypothetical protein VIF09_01455 [Polyangiaceae bacterium]|jgi:hypothetical protein
MNGFHRLACLLAVSGVGLAALASACGGSGNATVNEDGGTDGSPDVTTDSNGGDVHVGNEGGGDSPTEGSAGEGGKDGSGNDGPTNDGPTAEGSTEGGGEGGSEGGVEGGTEAGEAGPEAGVTCDAVNGTAVVVDPKNGDDATGFGSGTAGGTANGVCAFKTITYALAHLGTAKTVNVLGTAHLGTKGAGFNGETFPLAVPAGVSVIGGTAPVPTIEVPTGTGNAGVGFLLATAGSVVQSFVLNGNSAGIHGVQASTGSTAATSIDAVEVTGMAAAGIRVDGTGILTIGAGTQVHNNGITGQTELSGLHVTDTGHAVITGGTAPIKFYLNGQDGILVDGAGSVHITGTPGTGITGNVLTEQNTGSGLVIHQTAPAAGSLTQNVVTGLVAVKNTLDGAQLFAGSNVVVRGSVFLSNSNSGVHVDSTGAAATQTFDVSKIDLGTDTTTNAGKNTFQAHGANANTFAGLCLDIQPAKSQSLNAEGNTWVSSTNAVADCSAAKSTLTENGVGKACLGAVDVGGTGLSAVVAATSNGVDVALCSCTATGTSCQ